jgi:hypothetical protein
LPLPLLLLPLHRRCSSELSLPTLQLQHPRLSSILLLLQQLGPLLPLLLSFNCSSAIRFFLGVAFLLRSVS